jgi:hypothetical protein
LNRKIEKIDFTLKYATTILLAPNRIPTSAKLASLDAVEVISQSGRFRKKDRESNK